MAGDSIFGSSPSKPSGGGALFGGSGSTTSAPATPSQPTGQALFGGSGLFGSAAAQTSTSGLFGASGGDSSSSGGGLFGKPAGGGGGLFGQVEKQLDPFCFWTPLDQLTEAEKTAYQAPEFELGNVPTRPPPKEWCF